jgi:aldehyde:ferredoxin oxidoreductase
LPADRIHIQASRVKEKFEMHDNTHELKVLMLDGATGFYRMQRYRVGDFFGPVDLGIHLAFKHNALTIGAGLLAGSVFPGSNRLVFAGISPCWHGFYVSSMGGAALVFDNLGINMLSLIGKAPHPSLLYLNRNHGEEIEVEPVPVVPEWIWDQGRKGVYSVMEHAIRMFGPRYEKEPRVLAVGPAARDSDFGAIGSATVLRRSSDLISAHCAPAFESWMSLNREHAGSIFYGLSQTIACHFFLKLHLESATDVWIVFAYNH